MDPFSLFVPADHVHFVRRRHIKRVKCGAQLLRRHALQDRKLMSLLGGLLNENKLAELPEDGISTLDQDLTSEIRIVNLHFQSLAAGATAIEREMKVYDPNLGCEILVE